MQKISCVLISVFFIIGAMSCKNAESKQEGSQTDTTKSTSEAKLEVLYFHSTYRCVTCNAVENNAKKLIEENYKAQLDNGTIKFASYNVDDEANKTLAEKYQISSSTLLIINKYGKKEIKTDFTDIAFQYANTNPGKYAELLKTEIDKNIKMD
jgi:hypothetical protein